MWSEARSLHQTSEKSEETPDEYHQRKEMEEREERQEINRAQYSRIFGNEVYVPPPQPVEQPKTPRDPRLAIFGSRGKWRM